LDRNFNFDILEEGDAVPAEVHDVRRDLSSRRTKVLHQQNLPGYGIFILSVVVIQTLALGMCQNK